MHNNFIVLVPARCLDNLNMAPTRLPIWSHITSVISLVGVIPTVVSIARIIEGSVILRIERHFALSPLLSLIRDKCILVPVTCTALHETPTGIRTGIASASLVQGLLVLRSPPSL